MVETTFQFWWKDLQNSLKVSSVFAFFFPQKCFVFGRKTLLVTQNKQTLTLPKKKKSVKRKQLHLIRSNHEIR